MVALAGFSVLFFSVDAVKLNVIDFIVRSHEVATEFHIEDMLGNVPEQIPELNESDFMEPTYIPSGFSQNSAYFMTGHGYIVYERPGCEYLLNYSCMTLNTFYRWIPRTAFLSSFRSTATKRIFTPNSAVPWKGTAP